MQAMEKTAQGGDARRGRGGVRLRQRDPHPPLDVAAVGAWQVTKETKAILFPIDGFSDVNADAVQAAADELALLLRRFFGDGIEIETGTVTKDAPRFDFF